MFINGLRIFFWLRTAAVVQCAAIAMLLVVSHSAIGAVEGDRALLLEIADAIDANAAHLVSWRGAVTISSPDLHDESGATREKQIEFVLDVTRPALMRRTITPGPTIIRDRENGRALTFEGSAATSYLTVGDTLYRMSMLVGDEWPPIRHVRISAMEPRLHRRDPFAYDPREYLPMPALPTALRFWHDLSEELKYTVFVGVNDDGDYEVTLGDGAGLNRYVFARDSGLNLSRFETVLGDRARWLTTIEYEKRADVYVPLRRHYTVRRVRAEGQVVTRWEKMEWRNGEVNGEIDEREFSLESLGLRPGDLVVDEQIGITYKYGEEQIRLSPIDQEEYAPTRDRGAAETRDGRNTDVSEATAFNGGGLIASTGTRRWAVAALVVALVSVIAVPWRKIARRQVRSGHD
jgi:hypothetical protein